MSETGAVTMSWFWQAAQVVTDLVLGGVLIGLIVLYRKQGKFLRDRINVLEKGQQALQSEATALNTLTNRFLAVAAELSPEKLVEHVKRTKELLEIQADAKIAEVEREWREKVNAALAEKETLEQKAKRLSNTGEELMKWVKGAITPLAIALYELPGDRRAAILMQMDNEDLRKVVANIMATLEEKLGPSPAERSSAFGSLLARALGPGPSEANPFSRLRPGVVPLPTTDVTPGTPAEPMGESLTSP